MYQHVPDAQDLSKRFGKLKGYLAKFFYVTVCRVVNLYARVDGHKSTSSSVRKHYDNDHAGAVPEDLLSCFKVLKKCMNKFDCLVNEMLYIEQLTPSLNVQADSVRA